MSDTILKETSQHCPVRHVKGCREGSD